MGLITSICEYRKEKILIEKRLKEREKMLVEREKNMPTICRRKDENCYVKKNGMPFYPEYSRGINFDFLCGEAAVGSYIIFFHKSCPLTQKHDCLNSTCNWYDADFSSPLAKIDVCIEKKFYKKRRALFILNQAFVDLNCFHKSPRYLTKEELEFLYVKYCKYEIHRVYYYYVRISCPCGIICPIDIIVHKWGLD